MSSSELAGLEAASGVDFVALKKKYENLKKAQPPVESEDEDELKKKTFQHKEANERLNKYQVCKNCQGQGLVTETYNHMVMTKNCPVCHGEALVESESSKKLIESLQKSLMQ